MLPSAAALADLCRRAESGWGGRVVGLRPPLLARARPRGAERAGGGGAATNRAAIGTCILQLPLRHAPSVAKEAASLDHLSGGRLVLGVGVGTHPGEYAAAGVEFGDRGDGASTRASTPCVGHGRCPPATRYAQLPALGPVPVWVGGSSEAALRRAARHGDGWIPLFVPPDEYGAALGRLDKEAERVGRDPGAVARATVAFVSVGASGADGAGARVDGFALRASAPLLRATSRGRERPEVRDGAGPLRRSRGTTHRGLRHLRRPAGTVRGPGRRVRRPPRVPLRPADDCEGSPRAGSRRQDVASVPVWVGTGVRRKRYTVVDQVWR